MGDNGCCYLLNCIDSISTRIDSLNLSHTKMEKKSVELLSNILNKNNLKLLSLNISGNKLGDKNFSEISLAMSKNTHLLKLFTADNDLGTISSFLIGTILRYDKKIKWLDISKNKFDDDNVTNIYKGIISNNSLEGLILNENQITNKSLSVKFRFKNLGLENYSSNKLNSQRNLFRKK